jgi:amidase
MRPVRLPEYDRLDATALAALVARGEVTPLELLEAAVERVEARNPGLNAVVHRFDDDARRRAGGIIPAGPFRGVPLLVKDLVAFVEGQPATGSCRLFEGVVSPVDSEIVRRFRAAGFVIFGQTNTPELGILPVTEPRLRGPTRNPWNPEHTPGGSSGGSAAAVAARMVPLAHGNDGGGSIRIPASACGLFGLKPTRARTSFAPVYGDLWAGLVQEHVLTRSVRDSAAVLDAVAGNLPGDPYVAPAPARPFLEEVGAPPGRLRVAFDQGSLFGHSVHPDCVAAVREAARLLQDLGHEMVEARPRFDREQLVRAYLVIIAAWTRAELEAGCRRAGRRLDLSLVEPETAGLAAAGRVLAADDLAGAIMTAQAASREVAAFFERHDLLLTATMAHPPARVGAFALGPWERAKVQAVTHLPLRTVVDRLLQELAGRAFEATGNTMLFNITGQPAASLPLSWNAAGLPVGVQLAARFGDEATLLRVASQLEAARPWAERVAPAAT